MYQIEYIPTGEYIRKTELDDFVFCTKENADLFARPIPKWVIDEKDLIVNNEKYNKDDFKIHHFKTNIKA